jgi:hypothetical protein
VARQEHVVDPIPLLRHEHRPGVAAHDEATAPGRDAQRRVGAEPQELDEPDAALAAQALQDGRDHGATPSAAAALATAAGSVGAATPRAPCAWSWAPGRTTPSRKNVQRSVHSRAKAAARTAWGRKARSNVGISWSFRKRLRVVTLSCTQRPMEEK